MTNPLLAAYPGLSDKIPHCDFGTYPTPVERLTGLEKELGIKANSISSGTTRARISTAETRSGSWSSSSATR